MDRAENIRRLKEQAKLPKFKKRAPIAKKSAKKIAQEKEEMELQSQIKALNIGKGADLTRWFEDRRKEMTGRCLHCNSVSCKQNDEYYKFSIAHILPKRLFKSIATHPLNWIELCFWGNSCHSNFDNNTLDITELNCFDTVIERFIAMYPYIDKKERKYIPEVLLQYLPIDIR
jgi:hypothetical protein